MCTYFFYSWEKGWPLFSRWLDPENLNDGRGRVHFKAHERSLEIFNWLCFLKSSKDQMAFRVLWIEIPVYLSSNIMIKHTFYGLVFFKALKQKMYSINFAKMLGKISNRFIIWPELISILLVAGNEVAIRLMRINFLKKSTKWGVIYPKTVLSMEFMNYLHRCVRVRSCWWNRKKGNNSDFNYYHGGFENRNDEVGEWSIGRREGVRTSKWPLICH